MGDVPKPGTTFECKGCLCVYRLKQADRKPPQQFHCITCGTEISIYTRDHTKSGIIRKRNQDIFEFMELINPEVLGSEKSKSTITGAPIFGDRSDATNEFLHHEPTTIATDVVPSMRDEASLAKSDRTLPEGELNTASEAFQEALRLSSIPDTMPNFEFPSEPVYTSVHPGDVTKSPADQEKATSEGDRSGNTTKPPDGLPEAAIVHRQKTREQQPVPSKPVSLARVDKKKVAIGELLQQVKDKRKAPRQHSELTTPTIRIGDKRSSAVGDESSFGTTKSPNRAPADRTEDSLLIKLRKFDDHKTRKPSSVGYASESHGSGYIRLPTADILDVLGEGNYRLRVEDIVYEPVDEQGLVALIKGGVLLGAEEIAERDGHWMPIGHHPVFKALRKRMAQEAHSLLSQVSTPGALDPTKPVQAASIPVPPALPEPVPATMKMFPQASTANEVPTFDSLDDKSGALLSVASDASVADIEPAVIVGDAPAEDSDQTSDPIVGAVAAEPEPPTQKISTPFAIAESAVSESLSAEESDEALVLTNVVEPSEPEPESEPVPPEPVVEPPPVDAPLVEPTPATSSSVAAAEEPPQEKKSRGAWIVFGLFAAMVAGAIALLATGVIDLSPQGERAVSTKPKPIEPPPTPEPVESPKPKPEPEPTKVEPVAKAVEKTTAPDKNPNPIELARAADSKQPGSGLAILQTAFEQEPTVDLADEIYARLADETEKSKFAERAAKLPGGEHFKSRIAPQVAPGATNSDPVKIGPDFGKVVGTSSGKRNGWIIERPNGERVVFVPERIVGDANRALAVKRLCALLQCAFKFGAERPASIAVADLSSLISNAPTSSKSGAKKLESDALKKSGVINGVMYTVESGATFPIFDTGFWRPWIDGAQQASPFVDVAAKAPGKFREGLNAQSSSSSTREISRQLSSLMLVDFLINNWDRFDKAPSRVLLQSGNIVAQHTSVAFEPRASTRVRGRFEWLQAFDKGLVERLKALDESKTREALFPNATAIDKARFAVFWKQRANAIERIEALTAKRGENRTFPFEK